MNIEYEWLYYMDEAIVATRTRTELLRDVEGYEGARRHWLEVTNKLLEIKHSMVLEMKTQQLKKNDLAKDQVDWVGDEKIVFFDD